jgi:hypothetical protein
MLRPRILLAFLLAIIAVGIAWLMLRPLKPRDREQQPAAAPSVPLNPPALLAARVGTVDHPLHSWERLLAVDGTPSEDLAALAGITINYLQSVPPLRRALLGFNEDLARALVDRDALGEAALPANHPALVAGKLVDRWGRPWQVHPLSVHIIQLRSAGPDGRLYTADDLVEPQDTNPP